MSRAAIDRALATLNRYPDPSNSLLRQRLSDRYGVPVSRIAIGNGSCDILLLSHRSTFSLPQVKSGGWGAGTFLMRLLGPLKIRAAMFTGRTLTANEIAAGGQVEDVLPPEQLRDAARRFPSRHRQLLGHCGRECRPQPPAGILPSQGPGEVVIL